MKPERFEVTIRVTGRRRFYYVEVPTFQGIEAAKRRALVSMWSQFPTLGHDKFTILEAKSLDQGN